MSRYVVQAGWDHAPHLTEEAKKEIAAGLLPHVREARMNGVPSLGSGAIYPVAEADIVCEPFKIPAYYDRAYGLDVGWNKTAAIWGAWDRDNDVIYAYSEHYRGGVEPAVHAAAINARGKWIKGTIDPASRGRSQVDGRRLIDQYNKQALNLVFAENAVEAGLQEVYQRLSTGRLKIFSTLQNTLSEYRIYRRDDKGRIVKQNDHLMDALRYLVMMMHVIAGKPTVQRQRGHSTIADTSAGY